MVASSYMVPYGILKIVEFVCLLVSFSITADQYRGGKDDYVLEEGNTIRPPLYIFMCVITWIFCLLSFILNMAGKFPTSRTVDVIVHFVLGALVLFFASLFANTFSQHKEDKALKASVALGVISSILLIVDAFLYVIRGGPKMA